MKCDYGKHNGYIKLLLSRECIFAQKLSSVKNTLSASTLVGGIFNNEWYTYTSKYLPRSPSPANIAIFRLTVSNISIFCIFFCMNACIISFLSFIDNTGIEITKRNGTKMRKQMIYVSTATSMKKKIHASNNSKWPR